MFGRLLRTLAALTVGQAVGTIGNLLLVPLYLSRWGEGGYGEWLALSSVGAYVASLDLGLSPAVMNELTRRATLGDQPGFRRMQASALRLYLSLGAGGLALLAALTLGLPLHRWVGVTALPDATSRAVIVLVGVQVALALPAGLVVNTWRALGDAARSQWIGNAQRTLLLVVTGGAVLADLGPVAVAGLQLVPALAAAAFAFIDLARKRPWAVPSLVGGQWEEVKAAIKPSAQFLAIQLSVLALQQGSVSLVGAVGGGVAVAVFGTTRTLANSVRQLVGLVNSALWPELTRLEAREERTRLAQSHRFLVVVSGTATLSLGAWLACEGHEVIALWTGGRVSTDHDLLLAYVAFTVIQTPWLASSVLLAATNRHGRLALAYAGSAILGLGLAAVLVPSIGPAGAPLGFLVGEAVSCMHFVPRWTCELTGESYGRFAARQWTGLFVGGAVLWGTGQAAVWAASGWPVLARIALVAAACGAMALPVGLAWLSAEDRALVSSMVGRVRARFSG